MNYSPREKEAFKAQFAKIKSNQFILVILLIPLIIVAVSMRLKKIDIGVSEEAYGPVFFGVVVVALIFSFYNWRCPGCKKYLGKQSNIKFCSKCGLELV